MKNPFRRKQIPFAYGLPGAHYTQGEVFGPGAEGLVYTVPQPHPVQGYTPRGGGIVAGQLVVNQRQVIYQYLSLPVQPILPGVGAGQLTTAALTDPNTLNPNNPNDAYLSNSLFGGVQS